MMSGGFGKIALAALAATLMASAVGGARLSEWRWPALPVGAKPPSVPETNTMTAAKVALGRRLFYDADLSRDGTLSCGTCHEQKRGFSDGNRTHMGVFGDEGIRNVQGLANVAWRSPLTWGDASVATLEQQAMIPVTGEHPVEMGMKDGEAEIARRLGADACYRQMFAAAFPHDGQEISLPKVGAALAAFERTLISRDSPYDRYRVGQRNALTVDARRGEAQFGAAGCADCHSGPDFTDNTAHYVGTSASKGASLYSAKPAATAEEATEHFRTPPLRNVAVTGPWLHDGSAATMEDAIRRHAAAALVNADMPALLAFLAAQTDETFLKEPRFSRPAQSCKIASR